MCHTPIHLAPGSLKGALASTPSSFKVFNVSSFHIRVEADMRIEFAFRQVHLAPETQDQRARLSSRVSLLSQYGIQAESTT